MESDRASMSGQTGFLPASRCRERLFHRLKVGDAPTDVREMRCRDVADLGSLALSEASHADRRRNRVPINTQLRNGRVNEAERAAQAVELPYLHGS